MRKRCQNCGFINFESEVVCKKCGSGDLTLSAVTQNPVAVRQTPPKSWSFLRYPICLALALIIEFFALFPVLANIGMRHSAAAPLSEYELRMQRYAFIFHLPTVLITYLLSGIDAVFFLLTPVTQVIFWMFFLLFVWKKIKGWLR